ncbi:Na driven multidrug efflux pump [Vibrio sp. B1FLJ16]|uniref:MATE family efflux transporter n=1 Tax=Vibrio sp. B1FLJ16 TaxID=2751178 RepID=UPI0015F63B4F|nr:MATE family efflux transporter [Vibrio sp. B1FLJ16]CAD7820670.1 Na driven multidrug efflux pump [Vibrio sp. B1FLJ16]CAE6943824.1 Na driven multidrug efflux pump [Vibrio sp. B1FLJ16]
MLLTTEYIDKAFWKRLIAIALPVSLQSTLFALLGVVDIFMVSQLGESATAAVGVVNRIFFFNLAVIFGLCGAVTVLASQYYGSGNINGIRRTLAQSWFISMLFTIPFIIIYLMYAEEIVSFMAQEPEYVGYAQDYLVVTAISLIATAIVVPIESVLRSVGEAKLATQASILAIIVNIVLNTVLIFGLLGFPQWGVFGAAVGTFISRFFQTAVLVYFFCKRYAHYLPTKFDWEQGALKQYRKKYFQISLPMLIHDALWTGGLIVYSILYGQLGVSELAIISFLSPIEGVLISTFMGFAVAASVLLGNDIGSNKYDRVEKTAWWYVLTSSVLAITLFLIVWVCSPLIYRLLEITPLSDTAMALNVCLVMALGMILRVFNMVGIGGVLKSGADIRYSIFIDTFGQWAIGIPLTYYTGMVLGLPLHYVLMSLLAEEFVKGLLTIQRINSKRWINNMVDDDAIMTV